MKITELQDKISRLSALLQDPQPGLMSWNLALGDLMEELTKAWLSS